MASSRDIFRTHLRTCLRRLGALPREARGANSVEMALIAPVLLILLVGGIDLGGVIQELSRTTSAARAGAFYGARDIANTTNTAAIVQAARDDANDAQNKLAITATRSCECAGGGAVSCGDTCGGQPPRMYVTVQVQSQHESLIPYPFLPESWTLKRSVSVRAR